LPADCDRDREKKFSGEKEANRGELIKCKGGGVQEKESLPELPIGCRKIDLQKKKIAVVRRTLQ